MTAGDRGVIRGDAVATARHAVIDRPLSRARCSRMSLRAQRVKHRLQQHLLRQLRSSAPQRSRSAAPARGDEIGVERACDSREKKRSTWFVAQLSSSLSAATLLQPRSLVRSTARALLGRDSESLSERNFTRILQDAHDADVIDLRRRGDDYEVAAAVGAAPVAAQLAAAETANTPAAKPLRRGTARNGSSWRWPRTDGATRRTACAHSQRRRRRDTCQLDSSGAAAASGNEYARSRTSQTPELQSQRLRSKRRRFGKASAWA